MFLFVWLVVFLRTSSHSGCQQVALVIVTPNIVAGGYWWIRWTLAGNADSPRLSQGKWRLLGLAWQPCHGELLHTGGCETPSYLSCLITRLVPGYPGAGAMPLRASSEPDLRGCQASLCCWLQQAQGVAVRYQNAPGLTGGHVNPVWFSR